jgi:hypothetical protein
MLHYVKERGRRRIIVQMVESAFIKTASEPLKGDSNERKC